MVDIQVSATQIEKEKRLYLAGRPVFGMCEVAKSSVSNTQANRVLEKQTAEWLRSAGVEGAEVCPQLLVADKNTETETIGVDLEPRSMLGNHNRKRCRFSASLQ